MENRFDQSGPNVGRPDNYPKAGGLGQIDFKVEIMLAAGLEDDEIIRLAWLKRRVEVGECDDLTIEHKRLTFLNFLHETGRVQS